MTKEPFILIALTCNLLLFVDLHVNMILRNNQIQFVSMNVIHLFQLVTRGEI
jgi:hypothetical protein